MKESPPKPESPKVSRDQVIAIYKKFVEKGITNPDGLDFDDPEVKKAHDLFYKWQAQEDIKVAGNEDVEKRLNFEKTKIFVDAGFTDSRYLEDVLGWLIQDAVDIEKKEDNPTRAQLRDDYALEIRKIRSLLQKFQ